MRGSDFFFKKNKRGGPFIRDLRVSDTPYYNYSLLCNVLLDVFCSTIWNLVEHKLLFPVAILCCMLLFVTISAMTFMRYSLNSCILFSIIMATVKYIYWLYHLLLRLKYFLWDIINKIQCCWVLAVLYCNS